MNKVKKILTPICVLALSVGLFAGCQSNTQEADPPPKESGKENTKKENNEEKVKDPISITIMAPLKEPESPPDLLLNEIEKLTNTELEYQFFPDENYEEKLNTSLATESFPQVVYLKNANSFLLFKEAIRDEQFWELGPYLSEFKNLSSLKETTLNNTKVDGKLYSLYVGRPLSRAGVIYRQDWADNLGIDSPTDVDELFEMFRAFTEDDPDGNGLDDTFGLTDRNDLVYGAFKAVASWHGAPNNWGEKDGQLLPQFMFDEYIDAMDYMKKVHEAGYMNQDFPVTSKSDQRNLFYNGTAGVYIGTMSDVSTINNETTKNFPDAVMDVQNYIEGPHGEFGTWSAPGYGNLVLFPKSSVKSEEELKDILGFFDKMMTPEVSTLMYWGIEGEHYEVKDGKASAFADKKDQIKREVKAFKDSVIGEVQTSGRLDGFYELPARIKAEELILDNNDYLIFDPAAALDSDTYAEKGSRLLDSINDATYNYILGEIDRAGFDQVVENWKNNGGNDIIKEINEAWDAIN
ncbi:extracellular solute-binding protein [Chengkuizengella sp. SCS-71B]|uniref:extracellular solute-binding protein n=1 Tax=Chengkuizengella sp. SCS-71B TaxID=3115290 RepID=UPI0032C230F9